ncbi:hypothetical protein [Pseudonocardia xishanensis]|uniref:Uncharacterized protein n=1 Tax=Pseudonocardia xishanensis TaxID=630995 RepID=A0ABP8RF42_9PSEU
MFNVLGDLNWFAVIVSTLVFAVLGGLYFSFLVAKPYAIVLGNEERELPKPGPIFIVGPLVASLVVVVTSAVLLRPLSVESIGDGIGIEREILPVCARYGMGVLTWSPLAWGC